MRKFSKTRLPKRTFSLRNPSEILKIRRDPSPRPNRNLSSREINKAGAMKNQNSSRPLALTGANLTNKRKMGLKARSNPRRPKNYRKLKNRKSKSPKKKPQSKPISSIPYSPLRANHSRLQCPKWKDCKASLSEEVFQEKRISVSSTSRSYSSST